MVEIMRSNTFIPGLIIVFLGVIFTGGGLVMIISKRRKDTRCTAIAAGQVIERRVDHSKEGGPDALVIQYVVDDVAYTQETNGEGVRRKYKIGDEMGVE